MDRLNKQQRSFCMSQIKGRNTQIEVVFRKSLWILGARGYITHAKILGKPDIYFSKKKIAVFVDGCFWHKCPKCYVKPKSNKPFWETKIKNNVLRDRKINLALRKQGIKVFRFWEHQINDSLVKYSTQVKQYAK